MTPEQKYLLDKIRLLRKSLAKKAVEYQAALMERIWADAIAEDVQPDVTVGEKPESEC